MDRGHAPESKYGQRSANKTAGIADTSNASEPYTLSFHAGCSFRPRNCIDPQKLGLQALLAASSPYTRGPC